MRQRLFSAVRSLFSVALAITLVWIYFPTTVQAYQGSNLLQNPGFEQPYTAIGGDQTLRVASNWQPWFLEGGDSTAENARPEYQPAPANRVRSGNDAQEYNTFFATHTAGVFQRVPVSPGVELRFSVFIYVWSSATFDNPDVSEDPNDVMLSVGIDPTGGTDATSANIVWSSVAEFYDEYRELSVVAISQSTAVTVFVRSAPQGFVGTNNIYLDDASLLPLSEVPPTVPPSATTQPPPTGQVSPTPTRTLPPPSSIPPTAGGPTATPVLPDDFDTTIPYVVQPGDTVSGIAQRFNSSIDAIIKVNGLDASGLIYVGQTLLIPVRSGQSQPPTFTPAPTLPSGFTPTPVPPTGTRTYTVLPGDTLFGIAALFNTTINVLAQLNNIVNPNLIFPGQVLIVPGASTPPPTTPVPPSQPGRHVVQPGENLYRISLKYNVTIDALARANGIYNTSLIYPGQVLIIPGATTPTTPVPPPPSQPLKHVVQFGENLFRISLKYNVTIDALMRANGIFNPHLVFAGQVLIIPR